MRWAQPTATTFSLLPTRSHHALPLSAKLVQDLVFANVDTAKYRAVNAQVMYDQAQHPSHLLVFLHAKKTHRVDVARIALNTQLKQTQVEMNYVLSTHDFAEQPGLAVRAAKCPDDKIQFISFAPNDDEFEQRISHSVAQNAKQHGLRVAEYYGLDATRENYLNAMSCPLLKGNFYDGDANPYLITTADGVLYAGDIATVLNKKFRYKVVNIWLACSAYNEPLKSTLLVSTQTQKYAAGISDLDVGPSDRTAACAMAAALDGQPMTAAFQKCYDQYDDIWDEWGFDGAGTDYFGI